MKKEKIIIISGPTATGKSALGVRLAYDIGGEIVSADSMQVYKYMDIGTAKITEDEMQGIPHHMIDIISPKTDYSIAEYKKDAQDRVRAIAEKGKLPIVVGGTCFYIHALLYDSQFEESDAGGAVREDLCRQAENGDPALLHDRLRSVDPASAGRIHPNDIRRVVRALEYYELTGQRISEHNDRESRRESPYDFVFISLERDRDALYGAINDRVDGMMEAGLADEVRNLQEMGCTEDMVSMKGIGYKELLEHFHGKISMDEAVEKIKQASRRYAKRQMTWLRREKNVDRIKSPVSEEDYRWILEKCMRLTE